MRYGHYNSLSQNRRTPSRRIPGLPGVPALIRKPLTVVLQEANEETLARHLTLFDLVVIGVAGTVGSGIFAVVGLISSSYAGPAGILSWIFAGIGCVFSGLSYAELSSIVPSEGGAYAYAFVTLGELPAVITGWCLSLEFGLAGAAVARVWADKILSWVMVDAESSGTARFWAGVLNPVPKLSLSPLAGALQAVCVVIMLRGIKLGKQVTTVLTAVKMAVCAFIVIAGLGLFDHKNLVPFAPMGLAGIARGSSAAFFGYLGYDEVCALAAESVNPRRDVPISIAITLGIVSVTYVLAATALAGMVPISGQSGDEFSFVFAFAQRGWHWAAEVVAVGELVSLPVVVLASFMVQPRLLFVLANDGLIPSVLATTDEHKVLRVATIVSGTIMVVVAAAAPFAALDDFISAGVLLCFAVTNSCAIVIRRSNLDPVVPGPCRPLVLLLNGLCFIAGLLVRLSSSAASARADSGGKAAEAAEATAAAAAAFTMLAASLVTMTLAVVCPEVPRPAGSTSQQVFLAPFSPWMPSVGIAVSWVLMAQLSWSSLQWTLWSVLGVCVWYFTYGISHSVGQKSRTWPHMAAVSAAAATDTADPPRFPVTQPPHRGNPKSAGSSGRGARRSSLRTTFAGEASEREDPGGAMQGQEGTGPWGRGGRGAERQAFSEVPNKDGYQSFSAMNAPGAESRE